MADDDTVEMTGDDEETITMPVQADVGPPPSVCRMVHYVAFGTPGGEYKAGAHRAAVITEVGKGKDAEALRQVSLMVINPTGIHFREFVSQDENKKKVGTWHWPEKV